MNFKLKHKNVIAKGLISTLVLAGLVGAGYGVGHYVNNNSAHAIGLDTGSDDFYSHSAAGVEVQDYFGPFSLNGKWVWCIEPTRTTNTGADYTSRGDVMTANYTVRRFDVLSQTFHSEVSPDRMSRTVAAVFPYVMLDMPMDQVESLLRERGVADAENMINVVRSIRTTPDWARFTTIQLIFWQFTGADFQSPTRISVGAGLNAEYKTKYVNELLGLDTAGLQASSGSGTNQDWLMHWYHRIIQEIDMAVNYNKSWEYTGGAELWYSGTLQRLVSGSSGSIKKAGYLKATKEFSNLKQDLNTKPSWDPNGIKIGVYEDVNATKKLFDLTVVGPNGETETKKVEPGTYYGFELDVNGNPIKSVASEVVDGTAANRGYVSGSDKKNTKQPYIVWDVKAENTASNPDVETFVNTPEVVNFTFSKEIAADSIKPLEAIDPQYTRVGAVYTLYKDDAAKEPITRDGQNVTATIGADGTAEFSNLYRGVYYVKETAVPTVVKNGRTVKRFALDPKVYKVDLSTMNDNETNTGDSTEITTKEFKQVGSFVSKEVPSGENKGSLVIKKKDADTKSNTAQGQATLQGAEFKVEFYEMTTLGTGAPVKKWETVYKTDAKGEIDVRNRNLMVSTTNADAMNKLFTAYEQDKEWGAYDYRVTETKAPNGYKLGDEPQTKDFVVKSPENYEANNFTWQYDDASIYNNDLEIELIKTQRPSGDWLTVEDAKKVVIKNATFELTNTDTNDKFTATTDDNGKLKYNGIIAGNYTLREVSADKYITNGQIINLTVAQQDGTTKLVASSQSVPTEENGAFNVTEMVTDKDILVKFENTAAPAKVKLVKANEKGAKLEGAKFKFVHYSADGLTKLGETELTTNANGELNLEELVIGDWYTVEETKAPQGYKLPAERSVLRFRAEAIPAKDSYAISYWTSTVNKTSESNQEAVTSTIKKISTEDTVQDGIKFDADEAKGTMAIEFDFVNNTWKQLPATGSNFGMIAGVVAFAIVIGSTVFYVKRREA